MYIFCTVKKYYEREQNSWQCKKVTNLNKFALALVIVGAINWLLVGLFEFDLVSTIFGGEAMRDSSALSRIIYALVGIAGLYCISFFFREDAVSR